jgi:hypothetical protein
MSKGVKRVVDVIEIFIKSAFFDKLNIRKTSFHHVSVKSFYQQLTKKYFFAN